MSSAQEQYTESFKKSQQAVLDAFEAWTKTAQSAFTAPAASAAPQFGTDQVIDQVFDFAEQMLAVQRQFAKSLAATANQSSS